MRVTCFVTVAVRKVTSFRTPLLFVQTVEHSLKMKDETPDAPLGLTAAPLLCATIVAVRTHYADQI